MKWAVSPVIADGHTDLPRVCVSMYRLIYSLYHPGEFSQKYGASLVCTLSLLQRYSVYIGLFYV